MMPVANLDSIQEVIVADLGANAQHAARSVSGGGSEKWLAGEGRIAIMEFLERFPDYERSGTATRTGRVRFRGFSHLPVRLR